MCLKFENLRNIDWKSYFWEIWVQYKCFWKAFHLILMHFIHKILYFEEFLHKIALFFKKLFFFHIFNRSNLFFNRSKLQLKIWFESAYFDHCWTNRRYFWSIENRIESFLKSWVFTCFITIQTFSKTLSVSLQPVKDSKQFFVVFLQTFCKVFVF